MKHFEKKNLSIKFSEKKCKTGQLDWTAARFVYTCMLETDNSAFWISVNTVRFDWSGFENCVSIEQGKNQLANAQKENENWFQ